MEKLFKNNLKGMILQRMFAHTWENLKTAEERRAKAEELLKLRKAANKAYEEECRNVDNQLIEDIRKAKRGEPLIRDEIKEVTAAVMDKDGNVKKKNNGKPVTMKAWVSNPEKKYKNVNSLVHEADNRKDELLAGRNAEYAHAQDTTHRKGRVEYERTKKAAEEALKESENAYKKSLKGRAAAAKEYFVELPKKTIERVEKLPKKTKIAGGVVLGTTAVAGATYGGKKIYDKAQEKKLARQNYEEAIAAENKVNSKRK